MIRSGLPHSLLLGNAIRVMLLSFQGFEVDEDYDARESIQRFLVKYNSLGFQLYYGVITVWRLSLSTNWLTVEQIAQDLQVHPTTVREWIRGKKLKAAKFGRDYRIKREDYEQFIQEHYNVDDERKK